MKTRCTLALTLLGFLAGPLAGAAPLVGWSLVAQTAHVAIYTQGAKTPDAARIERTLVQYAGQLGLAAPAASEFYAYKTPKDIYATTGQYVSGLTYATLHQVHA